MRPLVTCCRDTSFRDVKGVSMETVTALDERIAKALFLSFRTEAETIMFFLSPQRQALVDLVERMTQISFQLEKALYQ